MLSFDELVLEFPEQVWLQFSEEDEAKALPNDEDYSNDEARWNAYLNCLSLNVLFAWFQEEDESQPIVLPARKDLPSIWEVVNGTAIQIGGMRIVLIPSYDIDTEEFYVPAEWVDIPSWVAHYYLAVQVNFDDHWLRVWGYTTHQQLKNEGRYNEAERTYSLEREDLIEDLNIIWVRQKLCAEELENLLSPTSPLPSLSSAEVEKLLAQMSEPSISYVRLNVGDFKQWEALLENSIWRQLLCQIRCGKVNLNALLTVVKTDIQQIAWTKNFIEYFQGWEDRSRLKHPHPVWKSDSELGDSINNWLMLYPHTNEEDFAKFCLNQMRNKLALLSVWIKLNIKASKPINIDDMQIIFIVTLLAQKHLAAFLQKIAYKAANKIFNQVRYRGNYLPSKPLDYSLDEIFMLAWIEASKPEKFFQEFNSQEGLLVKYANRKMLLRIKDHIFGTYSRVKFLSDTNYNLLLNINGKFQKEKALQRQGYREPLLSSYLLAWECFYQICTPNRRGRIEPKMEHWQAIASQYNHLRQEDDPIVGWQTIKDWIDNYCIQAAKNYLDPQFISIHASNQDKNEPEIDIPDLSPSPNDFLEQKEMREIVRRLETEFNFANFIQNLSNEERKLVLLRYGFELKQTDVAEEFNWYTGNRPDNSRVSKAEDRIFRELVKAILKWMVTSKILLEESVAINSHWLKKMEIKSACEMLMKKYYSAPVKFIMDEATSALTQQLSELEGNDRLAEQHEILKNYIVNQVKIHFDITLQRNGHAINKISSFWQIC